MEHIDNSMPLSEKALEEHSIQIIRKQKILLDFSKMAFGEANKIFQKITETISSFFNIERVSVWISDEVKEEMICVDLFNRPSGIHESGDSLRVCDFPTYFNALNETRCIAAHDVFSDERTLEFNNNYHLPLGIKSMMDVPVRIEGKFKGIFCCEKTGISRTWSLEEQDFASSVADIISQVIQTEEKHKTLTQLRKSEEELQKARMKAEESDRLKTSLIANMSHEFRTPMNAILGFSALITSESKDPDIVFFAKKIHSSGQRLMTTLKAILDLADLKGTKSNLKVQKINVQKSLHYILQPFYPVANEKNLYLITEFKNNVIALADENLLQMIMFNLVDNAVKFTVNGGVTIESDLKFSNGRSWVTIQVKDTGIGIAKEYFQTIFHEFRQLSEGYNRSYEGTGLGLTLAQRMAAMNDGYITVESEVGLGSIFTLWLPASQKTEHETEEGSGLPFIPVGNTIQLYEPKNLPLLMIVEDNDDNAEIIKLYVRGKFKTERAPDGYSAINMASSTRFDVVLMDINLGPGIDGLKTANEIRKIKDYQHIPIIALTGYTMAGDQEKLISGGCSHYLGKPFSQQGLLELLTEIIVKN